MIELPRSLGSLRGPGRFVPLLRFMGPRCFQGGGVRKMWVIATHPESRRAPIDSATVTTRKSRSFWRQHAFN